MQISPLLEPESNVGERETEGHNRKAINNKILFKLKNWIWLYIVTL